MPIKNVTLYDLILVKETARAYLVSNDDIEVWIPKSQVAYIGVGQDVTYKDRPAKKIDDIELPEWIAKKDHLI